MAQTLQTWQRRGTFAVGGTAGSRTAKEALTALRTALATTPSPDWYWEVTTDGIDNLSGGQEAPYLEITAVTDVGDYPMSILIAGLGGSATLNTDQIYNDGNLRYAYGEGQEAGNLYIAFAPQGRTGVLADPFGASSPYGSDVWSSYYRINISSDINEWLIYEHNDALILGMKMNGNNYRGVAIGDLITHYSPNVARSDGHGPAMFSFGGSARDVGELWYMGRQPSNYTPMLGYINSSSSTDDRYNPFATFWNSASSMWQLFCNVDSRAGFQPGTTGANRTSGTGFFKDYDGAAVPRRIELVPAYITDSNPAFAVGYLRQIRFFGWGVLDSTLLNGDESVAGYLCAAQGTGDLGDALALMNSL